MLILPAVHMPEIWLRIRVIKVQNCGVIRGLHFFSLFPEITKL